MEFTLDIALIRDILGRERALARGEIRDLGVIRGFANSQQRHDARIAAAPDVGTLACHAGCTWCCYVTVDVRAVEVFAILEVRVNSAMLRALGEDARVTRNLKCPLLSARQCSIYVVRPQSCRNYHATSVAGCRQSFEEPENLDIDPDFAPSVYQAGEAHAEAIGTAIRDAGYDVAAYELNCALDAALSEPARERFAGRLKPFTALEGRQVPTEFEDLMP